MPVITEAIPIVKTLGSANHWQVAETRIVTPADGDPFICLLVQAIDYTPLDDAATPPAPAQYRIIETKEVLVKGSDFAVLAGALRSEATLASDIKKLEYEYLIARGHIPAGTVA
jgi:hypothetical protein